MEKALRPKKLQHESFEKGKTQQGKLEKCGSLTLKEKMQLASEEAEDAEEAAALLKKKMTKLESSKVWSKHQTALKNGSEKDQKELTKD